jgi:hypothetical protein
MDAEHEPDTIEIYGLHGAGPLMITATEDGVHVGWPAEGGAYLDARAVDQLVHGLLEASAEARR